MTATVEGTVRTATRTTVTTGKGVRRPRGAAPVARPQLGGPHASPSPRPAVRRSASPVACRVTSPAAQPVGLVLRFKVVAVALVALVGVGVCTAEFASWSQVDPAVEYVAGHPAWAHVTGR
ncbi:MAG: hypothetical protein Q4P15_05535 [Propionibacteriaceae bacterium]|nr:hypothetical protein [Propionibacteriaceae bacterium]